MRDVVIAGGGPNGLMLACELSLAGVRPVVLERLPVPDAEPKANGLVGRVVPVMDRRGLYESLAGKPGPPVPNSAYFMFGALGLDLSLLDASPLYALPVPQRRIVEVLGERAAELGVEVRRGHEMLALAQDGDGVTVRVAGPDGEYELRTRYLVGAEGAHSPARKQSGIGFPGVTEDRTTTRSAHAHVPQEWIDPVSGALHVPGYGPVLPMLPVRTDHGGFTYAPLPGHPPLVNTTEWDQPEADGPMSLDEMGASIKRVLGAGIPLTAPEGPGPHVLRRLGNRNTRIAERFREGRVFLVGDAAHVYAAGGGPGLNLGLQDAVNLGWKLAAAVRGTAPAGLLDTYDTERRHAAARMVMNSQAQSALIAPGRDVTELRALFGELLRDKETVRRLAELVSGADVRYDLGGGHDLVGTFAPDLVLRTGNGRVRLAELSAGARPLLLDLTPDASFVDDAAGWADRVDAVAAIPDDAGNAALAGPPPSAVLLRPDGYIAWASGSQRPSAEERGDLREAFERWFGVPVGAA